MHINPSSLHLNSPPPHCLFFFPPCSICFYLFFLSFIPLIIHLLFFIISFSCCSVFFCTLLAPHNSPSFILSFTLPVLFLSSPLHSFPSFIIVFVLSPLPRYILSSSSSASLFSLSFPEVKHCVQAVAARVALAQIELVQQRGELYSVCECARVCAHTVYTLENTHSV